MSINQEYAEINVDETKETLGTGWLPPLPDLRDYTEDDADNHKVNVFSKIHQTSCQSHFKQTCLN
jgi:hypothetical protein